MLERQLSIMTRKHEFAEGLLKIEQNVSSEFEEENGRLRKLLRAVLSHKTAGGVSCGLAEDGVDGARLAKRIREELKDV